VTRIITTFVEKYLSIPQQSFSIFVVFPHRLSRSPLPTLMTSPTLLFTNDEPIHGSRRLEGAFARGISPHTSTAVSFHPSPLRLTRFLLRHRHSRLNIQIHNRSRDTDAVS
jgi:hypothetical protein